jgi:hypothetical protein
MPWPPSGGGSARQTTVLPHGEPGIVAPASRWVGFVVAAATIVTRMGGDAGLPGTAAPARGPTSPRARA